MDDLIDEEGEELLKIICGLIADALEEALDEVDEKEIISEDVDPMQIASKHLNKRFSYLEDEGWI
jgi:hypothetical protein